MVKIMFKAKALKWGNSYGFRVTKGDFERARIQVGQEVDLQVGGEAGKVDLSHIPTFRSGDRFAGRDHDEILYEARLEKMLRYGSIDQADFDKEVAKIRRIIKRRGTRVDR